MKRKRKGKADDAAARVEARAKAGGKPIDPDGDTATEAAFTEAAGAEAAGADTTAKIAKLPAAAELQNRLSALQSEFEQSSLLWREREEGLLRQLAELDNLLRRQRRDREREVEQRRGEILTPLIAVLDDLDRALAHLPEGEDSAFAEGIARIADALQETLARQGLRPIPAMGEKFDPQFHEALMRVESDVVDRGHVVQEIQKGYMLDDRVLRPSKVSVAG